MTYVVLARKYRPRSFADVIGQEVVTRVLAGALEEGRLGHAYLFAGPRGTGKTTIARILAKCLNCETGPTSTPCGTCERCRGADDGSDVDIIELDAASHTGVDTIRELRDEVAYAPMRARHKVYIIDEVHMLSKGAFNALLKTLEEPPPHVVFLFATTEPHKVLDTVLSRCQVLRLRPLTEAEITGRLTEVFEAEGVAPGPGVAEELARGAAGGMRDALSLADKLLALSGEQPTVEDLARLGGDGGPREVEGLLAHVEAGERAELLGALDRFAGGETELVDAMLARLRQSLLLAHCGEDTPLVTGGEAERASALERGRRLSAERVELWMQELLRARERMRLLAGRERLVLELTLLDLCRSDVTIGLGELQQRLEALAAGLGSGGDVTIRPAAPARPPKPAPTSQAPPPRAERKPAAERSPAAAPVAPVAPGRSSEPASGGDDPWRPFLEELGKTQGALARLLAEKGRLERRGSKLVIHCKKPTEAEVKLLTGRRSQGACARAMATVVGRDVDVELAGPPAGETQAEEPSRARAESATGGGGDDQRAPAASQDSFTQQVADLFGGVIEEL